MYSKHVQEIVHQRLELAPEDGGNMINRFNFEDPNVLLIKVITYWNN
jgi:hypothetical protein